MKKRKKVIVLAIIGLLVVIIGAYLYRDYAWKVGQAYGVDLSHHNTVSDWNKVKVDFMYLKATEGASYKDPKFNYYVKNAKKYGIAVGAYHFFRTDVTAESQFENFKEEVPRGKTNLIPAIDIERMTKGHKLSKIKLRKEVRTFVDLCYSYYDKKPLIYSGQGFYKIYLKGYFDDCPFWCGNVGEPAVMKHVMHQTLIRHVDGIMGRVDYDVLKVPLDEIKL